MKMVGNGNPLKSTTAIKISAFIFVSVVFFYFRKNWSDEYHPLVFFNSRQNPSTTTISSIAISPNFNKTIDILFLINDPKKEILDSVVPPQDVVQNLAPLPPPQPAMQNMGVVDENGVMRDDFEVGEFDPEVVDNWGEGNETDVKVSEGGVKVKAKKFGMCSMSMKDYIPCLDNKDAIKKLNSTEKCGDGG